MKIIFRETRGAEPLSHGFRRRGHVANGIGGVDLDELFENIARQLVRRIWALRLGQWNKTANPTEHQHPPNRPLHVLSSKAVMGG